VIVLGLDVLQTTNERMPFGTPSKRRGRLDLDRVYITRALIGLRGKRGGVIAVTLAHEHKYEGLKLVRKLERDLNKSFLSSNIVERVGIDVGGLLYSFLSRQQAAPRSALHLIHEVKAFKVTATSRHVNSFHVSGKI
jgi:hypothetical protein